MSKIGQTLGFLIGSLFLERDGESDAEDRLFPRVASSVLLAFGFSPQRTNERLAGFVFWKTPNPRRKRDGQGYRLMLGPLCDADSQQLMPGGFAILFAWGHPNTNILKKGRSARSSLII